MSDALLSKANATPLAKDSVRALAEAAPASQLIETLERALDDANLEASTALALAIGVAGAAIPAHLALRLLPDLDSMEYFAPIASVIEGDRVTALVDLAAGDRLSWEREALSLYLAVRLLDGAAPPLHLVARLRSLLRNPMSFQASAVAAMAAAILDDPEVHAVAGDVLKLDKVGKAGGLDQSLWRQFTSPVLDSLPEREERRLVTGFPFIRAEPKVGRNDPCPCGSGRKYKKCCANKEQVAPAHRSLVQQFQEATHPRVRQQLFEELRPGELEQLDPATLTTIELILTSRKLALHRRWEAAERTIEAVVTRKDSPDGSDASRYRLDLVQEAMSAGQLELAERQFALSNPDEQEQMRFGVQLSLARGAPDALSRLEVALKEGHANNEGLLIDCAFALLDHAPALGILAARGVISEDRLLDSETLLDGIGRARDTLGLPAEDPWWRIYDLLLETRSGEILRGAETRELERRDEQMAALRAELQSATARTRKLDEEVAKRERQLEALTAERAQLTSTIEGRQSVDGGRVAQFEEERQRLRMKIAALKGEVAAGAEQRTELRRELARSADQHRPRAVPPAPASHDDEHAADDAEGETTESRPRRILVPQFSPAASRSLLEVPSRVAATALEATAHLAAGDGHAWSGAKHMRRAHEILSVRIGRTWRLLFRTKDDRLDVLDLVHRSDLDQAIARLAN